MLKKLVYILLGVTTILLVTYFFRYKQASNFTDRIPATATAVINVNTRQLEHHLLLDILTHPLDYLGFSPSVKEDSTEEASFSIDKGVSIPKNILLYSFNSSLNNTWFSTVFELNDADELSRYLISETFNKTSYKNIDLYQKKSILFAVKDNQLIVVINVHTLKEITGKLSAIFSETNFLKSTSPLLKSIIHNKSDLCFATIKNDFLEANFKKGKIEVEGILNPSFDLFINTKQPTYSENTMGFLSGKFNKESLYFKELLQLKDLKKFEDFTHLSSDSIINKWNGNFSINFKSIEHKTDSIITYDYDDDFNKVAVISTQEIVFPNINITLEKTSEHSLFRYLEQKSAIKIRERDSIFAAIPLYEFYASDRKKTLEIFTVEIDKYQKQQSSKLRGHFNIEDYLQNPLDIGLLPIDSTYNNLIKEISIELSDENEFQLEINAVDSDRNFLGKLVK